MPRNVRLIIRRIMKVIYVYLPVKVEYNYGTQCTKTLYIVYTALEPKF